MKKPLVNLRIAVLIDAWFPFQGGGQVHVRETVKRLKENHGCQVIIFHGFSPNILARTFWSIYVIPQLIIFHLKKPFDLIHAHGQSAGLSAKIISLLSCILVVQTIHGSHLIDIMNMPRLRKMDQFQGILFKVKALLEKWLLTQVRYTAQITVAKNFLKYPNLNHKIYVIPNGVDIAKFKKRRFKSKLQGKIRLLFVGRLDVMKGIKYLFDALVKASSNLPAYELRIVGEGNERVALQNLAEKLSLSRNICFTGKLTGKWLLREYQRADLFVLPSLAEGQPIVLLEAWAAGLPVLVTSVGHNQYMVKEDVTGFLARPGDATDLAEVLRKAFTVVREWPKIGKRGQILVFKEYTWGQKAKAVYEVYKDVIK